MMISQMLKNQKSFVGDIWNERIDHNSDGKQLKDLQSEVNVSKQQKVDITKEILKKVLGRMPNWKSPGPDLMQMFWLKNFSSLHGRVTLKNAQTVVFYLIG